MQAAHHRPLRTEPIWVASALAALALGIVVYLAHRPPASAQWLPWAGAWAGHGALPAIWAGWLPSAVHAFAFALLTAAALPRTGPWRLAACIAWGGIDTLAELAQHPALRDAAQCCGQAWSRYVLAGRFDPGDLAAVLAGTALALAAVAHDRRSTKGRQ